MSRKLNSRIDKLIETLENNEAEMDAESLYEENIKLKALLARYGISIEDNNFSDIELLCIKQIEKFKNIFKDMPMVKTDAEALEKLYNVLSKEQEKEKAKEKKKEKTYTIAELTDRAKQSNG